MTAERGNSSDQSPSDRSAPKHVDDRKTPGSNLCKVAGTPPDKIEEIGGPKGPEPTRYGDWEKGGRCSDF